MKIIKRALNFHNEELDFLLQTLRIISDVRIIGGAVRDSVIGLAVDDIDIVTTSTPEEVMRHLTKHDIHVIPTGIKFGTVTAIISRKSFEITSLRKDIKCDGRHAIVEFTNDFAVDALRRDFTINALSYCTKSEEIYDYCGGFEDLLNKRVRFIGDTASRISEDYLRILRFFRFSAFYASSLDVEGYDICVKYRQNLSYISRERINTELRKMLDKTSNLHCLRDIVNARLDIFGDLKVDVSNLYDMSSAHSICAVDPTLNSKYAAIFFDYTRDNITKSLKSLLFSNASIKDIQNIHNTLKNESFIESWIDHNNVAQSVLVALSMGYIHQERAKQLMQKFATPAPILPVNGRDLMDIGIYGPDIGRILGLMKIRWIDSDCTLSKNELMMISI